MLKFGARSTGEPCASFDVMCAAAEILNGLPFPIAPPRLIRAERTFWEKATAIHVYCAQAAYAESDLPAIGTTLRGSATPVWRRRQSPTAAFSMRWPRTSLFFTGKDAARRAIMVRLVWTGRL
jgi:hypothetical protein